ncbi:apoptosis antagonizing transcription factor-like protein, partial [Volvox carteri f. nagariensis]
ADRVIGGEHRSCFLVVNMTSVLRPNQSLIPTQGTSMPAQIIRVNSVLIGGPFINACVSSCRMSGAFVDGDGRGCISLGLWVGRAGTATAIEIRWDRCNLCSLKDYDPDALDLGDGAKLDSDDEYGDAQAVPSKAGRPTRPVYRGSKLNATLQLLATHRHLAENSLETMSPGRTLLTRLACAASGVAGDLRRAPEKAMLLRGDIVLEDSAYRGRKTSRATIFGADAESEGADDDEDINLDEGEDEEMDLDTDGEEDVIDDDDDDDEEGDDGGERQAAAGRAGPRGRGGTAARAAAAAKRTTAFSNGTVESSEGEEGEQEEEEEEDEAFVGEGAEEDREMPNRRVRDRAGAVDWRDEREGQRARTSSKGSSRGAGDEFEALEAEYEALQEEDDKQLEALRHKGERDRVKGAAVRNQQVLYERTLEQRILLQKCLQASNGLPRPETYAALVAVEPEVREGYSQLAAAARDTLNQLLELQHTLMARIPAVTLMPSAGAEAATASGRLAKRRRPDTDGAAEVAAGVNNNDLDDSDLESLWQRVSARHEALAPFRDASLDSWHRRTVLSSGSGALRNSGLRALNQSISSQVQALMRDPAKFIKRTRLALSACPRVLCEPPRASTAVGLDPLGGDADGLSVGGRDGTAGTAAPTSSVAVDLTEEERDPETYDDSEFYQQLLKEFLDKGLAEGAAAAPKAAKKRKLVDRRASKGRKLRYHVQHMRCDSLLPNGMRRRFVLSRYRLLAHIAAQRLVFVFLFLTIGKTGGVHGTGPCSLTQTNPLSDSITDVTAGGAADDDSSVGSLDFSA